MPLHLFLSPHLDDAVLSCGGLIHRRARAGDDVLVLTIMAGDPEPGEQSAFAREKGQVWQAPEQPVARRRMEDRSALARLGARWLHWPYPDCIYRHHPQSGVPLYPSRDAIFGDVHPLERSRLVEELAARLQALCEEVQPVAVYSLLTAGHHVDHLILQAASQRLVPRGWVLRYYEDYPYAEDPVLLRAALAAAGGVWQAELELLDEADLAAKIEAVACYRSQFADLFGDEAAMRRRVSAYAYNLGSGCPAERYWRPVTDSEATR